MIRLGLTGTIGAGKSTVGSLFERWGAFRIDADRLAREAVAHRSRGLEEVRRVFGEQVLQSDGTLDRAALRRIVFADAAARERLEAIVHPEVDARRTELLKQAEHEGRRVVVLEIPLLFEKGLTGEFDAIVVVDAPVDVRRARVRETRDISPAEFNAMDASQWAAERKRAGATHVIWNAGDLAALEAAARLAWEALTGRPAASAGTTTVDQAGSDAEWRVDLHMHTDASKDCLSRPVEVVRRARSRGLSRIAITDHDEIEGAFAARDHDPELVIVGEEVRTSEGLDLIGLYLTEHIPPGGTFREVAAEIHRQGGIVYLPHPFDAYRGTTESFLEDVADCVDAVEGFNARVHDPARNQRAQDWALERGLPLGAGSDAHVLWEIGRGVAVVPPFAGPAALLGSLRAGRIEGRTSSHLVHLGSIWARLRKTLRRD